MTNLFYNCKICGEQIEQQDGRIKCQKCGAQYGKDGEGELIVRRFGCKICGTEVSVGSNRADEQFFEERGWECLNCYSVIYKNRYEPKNRGVTVFTPTGLKLGDKVMFETVRQEYLKANPGETVIFLEDFESLEDIYRYQPDKIFWANLYAGKDGVAFEKPAAAYWFSVCTESWYYALEGKYARLWFVPESVPGMETWARYVVVHFRNIYEKNEALAKNVSAEYAVQILAFLAGRIKQGDLDSVVIVGNDEERGGLGVASFKNAVGDFNLIDLRKCLTLPQLAGVCQRAMMFVGRDSGPMHVAAAAGARYIVAWGFVMERWFPRVPKERLAVFMKWGSDINLILMGMRKGLEGVLREEEKVK